MLGLYELASAPLKEAYELSQGTGLEDQPLGTLAESFAASGDYRGALEIEKQVLTLRQNRNQPASEAFAHGMIAQLHARLGEYDLAKAHYEESLKFAKLSESTFAIAKSLFVAGESDLFAGLVESAHSYLERSAAIFSTVSPIDFAHCHKALARLAIHQKIPRLALDYLQTAEKHYVSAEQRSSLEDLHDLYAEAYEQLDDWEKVARHYKKRLEIDEIMISKTFRAQLNEFQALFATERERHEKEIVEMKAQHLEKELANSAMHLAAQTELLGNFRNELRQIVREIDEPIEALKKIKEKLKTLPCEEIDWVKFQKEFTSVHPEFVVKLKERFPNLTKQEVKMCQLARLGLKTHEMAQLLCLSERTIDRHRNSLRKKLALKPSESLTNFFQNF